MSQTQTRRPFPMRQHRRHSKAVRCMSYCHLVGGRCQFNDFFDVANGGDDMFARTVEPPLRLATRQSLRDP